MAIRGLTIGGAAASFLSLQWDFEWRGAGVLLESKEEICGVAFWRLLALDVQEICCEAGRL